MFLTAELTMCGTITDAIRQEPVHTPAITDHIVITEHLRRKLQYRCRHHHPYRHLHHVHGADKLLTA
jgi:hypothetical protein